MIGVVVALLVSIIIGVMVWYKIAGSVLYAGWAGTTGYNAANRAAALATANATNTTASTVFTLLPVVAIVVVAGIILAIVTNFGKGQA